MNNYIDYSRYSDNDIVRMQKEKKKEYIILIQSEIIAKKLLNKYGESLYTTNYHYRLNSEYGLLNERILKKRINYEENEIDSIIRIPLFSIICRLTESRDILVKNNNKSLNRYNIVIDELIDIINNSKATITYENGQLYYENNDIQELIDDNNILELFTKTKSKLLK